MKQASKITAPVVFSEPKELLGLVRAGKLYDIERWILSGRPLELPVGRSGRKKTLLQAAVETGFHSLVELVAKHESSQESKNVALTEALSRKRLDLIELLVAFGAEAASVPFADVLLVWEPKIIGYFINHGADLVTGSPLRRPSGRRPVQHCVHSRSASTITLSLRRLFRSRSTVHCDTSATRLICFGSICSSGPVGTFAPKGPACMRTIPKIPSATRLASRRPATRQTSTS